MKKECIDILMVKLGLADSRQKAQAFVMAGIVLVNEKRVEKPSEKFLFTENIRLKKKAEKTKFVGRGGLKLERALEEFYICINRCVCLDIGASTGGFTDCLLQNGAKKVYAVDVGTNQLVWELRSDERVIVRENTNARYLKPEDFEEDFALIVMDVSFISVRKIFPAIKALMKRDGKIISLIKPQFEVGKGEVGEGGIVRNIEKQENVVAEINEFAQGIGLNAVKTIESPILGAAGNREFLVLYERV